MLQVTIPGVEYYNDITETFVTTKSYVLDLEHSLISLSKWESKWKKPFLSRQTRTLEESADYIRCMTITKNVDPEAYKNITSEIFEMVDVYINDPMTATWFNERNQKRSKGETITSEIIYYSMVALNIPFECEKWHLNRLITLIQVCNIKNSPEKKMNKKQILQNNHALNEARKQKMNTNG